MGQTGGQEVEVQMGANRVFDFCERGENGRKER